MKNQHSVADHWSAGFDEAGLQQWAEDLRGQLGELPVSLGLVFMSPTFFPHARQVLEILRVHAQIPLLAGCSSSSLIFGDKELENDTGIVLGLYSLPGVDLKALHFTQQHVAEANGPAYWHHETGLTPEQSNGWLVFADPFQMDCEGWLTAWNEAYASSPVIGGLASGGFTQQSTQVYLNGDAFEEGVVIVSIGGRVKLAGVISQGCTPIGETWTITRVERNIILEIGSRPAYEMLARTFNELNPEQQVQSRGNLFIGLVINEYLEEFHRGDFLIRNLLGADPNSGAIAVGALPRTGQTMQFQRRDAAAADEDMAAMLARTREVMPEPLVYGGCLCSCNGRGVRLFGVPSHDARMVQEKLGPLGLAGFFCNGEIGPVGDRSFLHGYTACAALFVPA